MESSPTNNFQSLLLLERYPQNGQVVLSCYGHERVKQYLTNVTNISN